MSMNGKAQTHGNVGVTLRGITGLRVRTHSQLIDEKTTKACVTGWKGKISPENYVIQALRLRRNF